MHKVGTILDYIFILKKYETGPQPILFCNVTHRYFSEKKKVGQDWILAIWN